MSLHQDLLPRVSAHWINAKTLRYIIVGLAEQSPQFMKREDAEGYLATKIAEMPISQRPMTRQCMRCKSDFVSQGWHNRMCNACRSRPSCIGEEQRPRVIRGERV